MGSLILQGSEVICTNCVASVVIPIINKQFDVGGQASGSLAEKTKRHWPCEKEKIQLIQIPILIIMDERSFGVVDSGASKSVIPHFLVQKYNFENTGASKVKLINSAILLPRGKRSKIDN